MKILLVRVPSDMDLIVPPIGLAYLASSIKKQNSQDNIRILDCPKERYNIEDFEKFVKKYQPDVVGFTAFSFEIPVAFRYISIVKKIDKRIITVLGGIHASTSPGTVLENKDVDFLFLGEAENSFPELIKQLKKKQGKFNDISGLGYIRDNKIHINKSKIIENLDTLPIPDYDLIDPRTYPRNYISKNHPVAPILTSRGCPFSCTFCSGHVVSGKKWRFRNPWKIVEEIKMLKKKYGIKEFQIWDDNFTLRKDRAMKFCDLLLKEKINLPWWCPNGLRLETLDKELLQKMKDSGFYAINLGIESGSEKIQKDMKKDLNLKKLEEIVNIINELDIRCQGFFMIGYPTETKEDILKTINLAKKLKLYRASFFLFQPLLGSEAYYTLKAQGKLPKDFSSIKADYQKTSILPSGINDFQELRKLHRKAILEFYFRPKIFFRLVLENLSFSKAKSIARIAKKSFFSK